MILAALLLALPLPQGPDITILVMDDVGQLDIDTVATPNIDAFAAQSAVFRRAYAQPWCAPTRDSLMRGALRPVYRGNICPTQPPVASPLVPWTGTEPLIGAFFQARGYRTVNVGKWHLSRAPGNQDPVTSTTGLGFDRWLAGPSSGGGCFGPDVAEDGVLVSPGVPVASHAAYQAGKFLEALADARAEGLPFFGVLSWTDAHAAFNISASDPTPPGGITTQRQRFESEIRGIDAELGAILTALGPNALVFLIGDNGTPSEVAPDPARAKLTVYERGIQVPMIVFGPGVFVGDVLEPVMVSDIFPSLVDGLGSPPIPGVDGSSLLAPILGQGPPPRPYAYAENPTQGTHAVIEERWKLMQDALGGRLLFDLQVDPAETSPLPPSGADYSRLAAILDGILL